MGRKDAAPASHATVRGLGRRILRLRTERGWSTLVLARKLADHGCRVGASKITHIEAENARSGVNAPTLLALADVLDTTTDYLLGRTPDPTPQR